MEKDQKYQSQYRRIQSAPNAQYTPLQVADATARMQEEFNRRNDDAAATQRQVQTSYESAEQRLKIQGENVAAKGKDLVALGQFSKTLTDQLVSLQQEENQREKVRGANEYYMRGAPQEEQDAFDQKESELAQADGALNSVASDVGKETGQAYMERAVRGMSAWKAYGFKTAMLQDGGTNFALALATEGKDFSVDIGNGETLTFATANSLPEYQTVMDAFRRKYIAKYADSNPVMLNKYLFPGIRKAEEAHAVQWGKDQELRLTAEKKEEGRTLLLSGLQKGNLGEAYARFQTQLLGSYGNDPKKARDAAFEILQTIVDAGNLKENDIQQILDTIDPTTGKPYSQSIDGQRLGKLLTRAHDVAIDTARMAGEKRAIEVTRFRDEMKELDLAGKLTEIGKKELFEKADKAKIDWRSDPYLKDLASRNENDDDIKERALAQIYSPNGRGFLIPADLAGGSPALRQELQQFVKDPSELKVNKESLERLKKLAQRGVETFYGITMGETGFTGNSDAELTYMRATDNVQARYKELVREGMDPREAFNIAQEELKASFPETGEKNPYLAESFRTFPQQLNISVTNANQALSQDKSIITTGIIPGSKNYYDSLKESYDKGKVVIPEFYHRLAASQPNFDGWDLAAAQLKAVDGVDLLAPPWKQAEQQMTPEEQRLLKNFPTPSRVNRAALGGNTPRGDNWKTFLDMVASVESESHGGYDAYNLGGSNNGHTAHGSGNSATDGRYGRPLSQLTVNEVVELGKSNRIWAAGRYQFIPGTLRETIQEAGLSGEELFDEATQDRLAIARARWRMRTDKGMAGLRREWVGLNYVSDPVLRNAMNGIVDTRSPYNQASNMTPGVAKAVYTTGNIGPTSTGPHLDVKQVGGGRFGENALDNYVEVDDPEYGRIGLGELRQRTGGIGDSFDEHVARGSHGIDYGTHSGTQVYLKNGAKVVSTQPSAHGDILTIQLPNGQQYTFLHGTSN